MSGEAEIQPKETTGSPRVSRRRFMAEGFAAAAWGTFWAAMTGSMAGTVRFFFPNVLFEPPTTFKAGLPDEYPVGVLSERWKQQQRVWIVRTTEGFYALLAKCTHLGCTPNWIPTEDKFKCPCHGSGFHRDGVNFEGPAPRPLERVKIALAEDGQLLVDTSVRFRQETGEWEKPEAFLEYA
ncbi:MAG: ubiquinol-cytochrome c reductase iron-sulfur subunit [Armatimonadetes bacterium]|nr:ubiquinol-cytochrome c reductase iron-sulfur subunit [Armatimonadota bacterium]